MPIIIERISDEPILLTKVSGYLSIKAAEDAYDRAIQHCQEMLTYSHFVIDVRETTTSFTELIHMIKQAASFETSLRYAIDGHHVVLVGESHWAKLFSDAMRQAQFGGIEIPIFETIEAATHYIQAQIAKSPASA